MSLTPEQAVSHELPSGPGKEVWKDLFDLAPLDDQFRALSDVGRQGLPGVTTAATPMRSRRTLAREPHDPTVVGPAEAVSSAARRRMSSTRASIETIADGVS